MNIIFYHPFFDADYWLKQISQGLPGANVRQWTRGDTRPADYALVWQPPVEMLAGRNELKAVFALGAGVDSILSKMKKHPEILPEGVPLYRLEDTGMAQQMAEYAVSQTLQWFRRFDDYQRLKVEKHWQQLEEYQYKDFVIGVLGAGILGKKVAESLVQWGFPVRCWSRSHKNIPGVESFIGQEGLSKFLHGTRVLINLLPNTPQTTDIIDHKLINQLADDAYIMNIARGGHLVEKDLLAALDSKKVKAAMLDVFVQEPLPIENPLWLHPRVGITPHIAAFTRPDEATDYIVKTINQIEAGGQPSGQVQLDRGY